jgi:hypothetical protein
MNQSKSDMKTIIVVGDSYSFGQGCSDRDFKFDLKTNKVSNYNSSPSELCWPSLIEKNNHDKCQVINLSVPGNSDQMMFDNLLKCGIIPDVVFFSGSYFDRTVFSHYHYTDKITSHLLSKIDIFSKHEPRDYVLAKKSYLKYLYNDNIGFLNLASSIFGAYGYSLAAGAKFFWSSPNRQIDFTSMIEKEEHPVIQLNLLSDLRYDSIQEYDFSKVRNIDFNKKFLTHCLHINDVGHKIYYENMIKPIVEKIFI